MRYIVRRTGPRDLNRMYGRRVRGSLLGFGDDTKGLLDFIPSASTAEYVHNTSTPTSSSGSGSLSDSLLKIGGALAANALGPKPQQVVYQPPQTSPMVYLAIGGLVLGAVFIMMKD